MKKSGEGNVQLQTHGSEVYSLEADVPAENRDIAK